MKFVHLNFNYFLTYIRSLCQERMCKGMKNMNLISQQIGFE